MTPDELRKLADEQAPGGWSVYWEDFDSGGELFRSRWIEDADGVLLSLEPENLHERRAALIALAPDLARLCAEFAEALRYARDYMEPNVVPGSIERANAALAKLAELEPVA